LPAERRDSTSPPIDGTFRSFLQRNGPQIKTCRTSTAAVHPIRNLQPASVDTNDELRRDGVGHVGESIAVK
jgi:hypothetical protein